MTKKAAPPVIEAEATYRVVLRRSITVGRSVVHPGPRVRLRGDILQGIVDRQTEAVEAYEKL